MKIRSPNLFTTLYMICAIALVATWYGSRELMKYVIEEEAIGDAARWAEFVASENAGINAELVSCNISKQTHDAFELVARAGGIFRYKLFNHEGKIVHASRHADIGTRNTKPYFDQIVRSGKTFAKIETDDVFDPKMLVVTDAYAPLMQDGGFLGAIEIYVDETDKVVKLDRIARYTFLGFSTLMISVAIGWSFIVGRSIRTRKRFEKALVLQNDRFNAALDNMSHGLCMYDGEQRLIVANEHYASLYGLSAKQLKPGMTMRQILDSRIANGLYSGPSPEAYIKERLDWVKSGTRSKKIQALNDGRAIAISHTPMADGGWLTTHEDVTQRVRATQLLEKQTEELHHMLNKEKQFSEQQRQFVSMASHEFRTPLTIIDATAQRLQNRADRLTPEETIERTGQIRAAVGRMTRLMESTLAVARLEDGKVNIDIGACDIGQLLSEVCTQQQEIASGHVISCELAELPKTIRADSDAVRQVITNLLSNAVKYAPDAPDIQVKAFGEGDEVVISVRDRGLGIDMSDLPKMFDRFFRAKTSVGIAGTGIGLNISRTLLDLHGGSVEVESAVGEGSTFTIRLPVTGPAGHAVAKDRAA